MVKKLKKSTSKKGTKKAKKKSIRPAASRGGEILKGAPRKRYKRAPSGLLSRNTEKFCVFLRKYRSVSMACEKIGISRTAAYELRKKQTPEGKVFAKAWDESWEIVIDELEASTMERAISGWNEEVYFDDGTVQKTKRKHSPSLSIFMLKKNRRKYSDDFELKDDGEGGIMIIPMPYKGEIPSG